MRIGVGLSIPELATRGGKFSPASLFSGGVQGAWYAPDDFSTLFQDSAGTTPVTAVEQPVRLMLDKSQGLVLGSELVTNGDFSVGTGWSTGGVWVISGGSASITSSTTSLSQSTLSAVVGTWYQVTFTISAFTAGGVRVEFGGVNGASRTAAGTYTQYIFATSTSFLVISPIAISTLSIDNVSIKVIAGNHALAPNDLSRPVLRARYNQLTYSEQFDNAVWVLSAATVTANSTTAPDGTTTADTITFSSVAGRVQRAINMASQCISIYVKPIVGTRFAINTDGVSGADATIFNLSGSGSVVSTGANNNSSVITALADGWYRIVTARGSTAGTNIYLGALNSGGGSTDSFYIWGADLRTGSSAGTYQRIAAATDYATAGFLPYLYFVTDDSFGTNSIDFTATDKMSVCAGVTKLGTAPSIFAELSALSASNNGSFYVGANTAASNDYTVQLQGTSNCYYSATTYAAPITNVVSAQFDIAGAGIATEIIPRVNTATPTLTANGTTAGTGNFGNYPLFIGRRNNASLPFEGRIYQLIVCGKALSASELASTEAYVNSKTGAY